MRQDDGISEERIDKLRKEQETKEKIREELASRIKKRKRTLKLKKTESVAEESNMQPEDIEIEVEDGKPKLTYGFNGEKISIKPVEPE